MPFQTKAGLVLRPVDDEGQPQRLPAMAGIERRHADVAVTIYLAALVEFHHHAGSVTQIEHRQSPHFPEIVAWMRVVGEFDVHSPALPQAILDLAGNLLVSEIGQERETALGNAHDLCSL